MNYIYFNNFIYRFDEENNEKEILNFNINKVDHSKYNIVVHNKYTKKYSLINYNFHNLNYEKFEKNNDYSIYILFVEKNMIYIDNINKKLSYNHIFLNDYNSYSYISKYKTIKNGLSNDVLIIYYGSLKNYKNFSIFNERFKKICSIVFNNQNIKNMYCMNNDIYSDIYTDKLFNNESDISVLVDNLENMNFLYISYLISMFYKNINKSNFSKIIFISVNHSILGFSCLNTIKLLPEQNYYADKYFSFCIFNELDFIKICTLFPNYIYIENYDDLLNYIKKYSNIKFKKLEDISVLKIS